MRSRRLFALTAATLALIAWPFGALFRLFVDAFALFKPDKLAFVADRPAMVLAVSGRPLDRALVQGLRHEAGMQRRAAERHT